MPDTPQGKIRDRAFGRQACLIEPSRRGLKGHQSPCVRPYTEAILIYLGTWLPRWPRALRYVLYSRRADHRRAPCE